MKRRYTSKGGIKTYQSAESRAVELKQLKALARTKKKRKRSTGRKKGSRRRVNKRSVAKGLKRLVGL